jgi:hypothetical protein
MPPISMKNAKVVAGVVGAMNPGWSLLGDEPFRRRYGPRAEIVVPGTGNANEALGDRSPSVTGTTASFSPCTTSTGAVTLPRCNSSSLWCRASLVRPSDGAPLSISGLWDTWKAPENGADRVLSCTLIVTAANAFTRGLID